MRGGGHKGQGTPFDREKFVKNWEKEREIGKNQVKIGKREKIGKKRQKSGGFFHLPLLTYRAGYATGHHSAIKYSYQVFVDDQWNNVSIV